MGYFKARHILSVNCAEFALSSFIFRAFTLIHSKERAHKSCSELFPFTIDELLNGNYSENKEDYKF